MMQGAERAQAHPDVDESQRGSTDWLGAPVEDASAPEPEDIVAPRSGTRRFLAALLVLLALGWIGAAGWSVYESRPAINLGNVVAWTASLSAPLILLALLWLMFGRTQRRETERFTRAVSAMRSESGALQALLEIVSTRLEENHARLRGEAEKLMSLGDEASDRLGRVTYYLSKESATLDRSAAALESAAAAAKVDIGVLLHDLPRAEEQARGVAEALKDAGLTAHGQAGALEVQLAALSARSREADELLGGAAQRMAAHIARIETGSASAAAAISEASAGMTTGVDATLARAAEAIEATRAGLDTQGATMLAMIEQSRAAFERAGEDSTRNLAGRLDTIGGKMERLASHLAAQDAASHALVTGLAKELAELDRWFGELGRSGSVQTEWLAEGIGSVRGQVRELIESLGSGDVRAAALIGRTGEISQALTELTGQLEGPLPQALANVEAQAGRTGAAASALVPLIRDLEASSSAAAMRVAESEAGIMRQREALEALLASLGDGAVRSEEQLRALTSTAAEAEAAAARIVREAAPELVEALVRVREVANQAAEHAREAITAVIPASAATLADASRAAVSQAVSSTVEAQLGELSTLSQRVLGTARDASERLTRQMLAMGETAAAIEARIDEARKEREAQEGDTLSRRVALLIESLNSTAIDVTKILSNEPTDTAWAAYLKGDRGVFTRRAVKLIESGEAREITRHYEEEPEFREQVNRYIHDFEGMLRRVLADRDGSPLGITLLSSDMGKLYVALAQAIERLRR
jgi:hypothetical protein